MTARVRIDAKDGSHTVECAGDSPILHAALAAGLALPYECATGTCGTCRATLLSGSVEHGWADAPGRAHVAKEGGVLLCQCRPRGDCAVGLAGEVGGTPRGVPVPRRFGGRITARRKLTHDVVEVTVGLERPMAFRGGQFVLVEWPGVTGARAYSMVDAPGQASQLGFVIKDKRGGGISEKLFRDAAPADELRVFGPLGHAFFDPQAASNMILLAGGSGLGPLISVLRAASDSGALARHRARLVFGVRSEGDLFYIDQLADLQGRCQPNLAITVALSEQENVADVALPPAMEIVHGMVHEVVEALLDSPIADHQAFVAGPPAMVDACLRVLVLKGRIRPTRIKYDKYS